MGIKISIRKLRAAYRRVIWDMAPTGRGAPAAWMVRGARLVQAMALDVMTGQLTLRAMGLVYTTLLSIVPLLAFSFSVLKAMGIHNQMRPALLSFLAPLGDKAEEITTQIITFVERINVGVLGSIGVAFLIFTVLSLVHKVEEAFNFIWHVRHPRGFAQRFSGYLSVLLVGPVLVFAALGLTASLMNTTIAQHMLAMEPFGSIVHLAARLMPYVLVIAAFTVTYVLIPNTRVRPSAALLGGAAAGALWETTGWAFGSFMVTSTKYTAVYSGFAILILFMLWLFLSWLILLVGASIAFYTQHPEYQRGEAGIPVVSARMKERLALLAMYAIGRHHYRNRPLWDVEALTRWLGVPTEITEQVLWALMDRRLLLVTADDPPAYVPAMDLERIPLGSVLEAVRGTGDTARFPVPEEPAVDALMEHLELEIDAALAHMTLRDLVRREDLEREATGSAGTARTDERADHPA